jgi:hypothetical protein
MRIFISYSGKHGYDGYVADSIAAALALRKVEYFYDRQSIRVGDDILRAIQQAIDKSCTHFLILASFASDKADWPHRELEMAVQRGLSLIPMAIAARENDVPELLRNMKRALFAPLRSEVATLFEYLGLGPPPRPGEGEGARHRVRVPSGALRPQRRADALREGARRQ